MRRGVSSWLLGLGLAALGSAPAFAEVQVLQSQRYQTAPDSLGLGRTISGRLLPHLDFDVGMMGDYEHNALVARDTRKGAVGPITDQDNPLVRNSPLRERVSGLLQDRVSSEASLSIGLFGWVQLFAAVPVTYYQQSSEGFSGLVRNVSPMNQFNLGDLRLGGKIRILKQESQFVDLAIVPQLTLPVGLGFRALSFDRPIPTPIPDLGSGGWASGYTSEGFLTFQPEVALSRTFMGFFFGGNLGLRLRRPYEFGGITITQEVLGRAGVGFKGRQLAERVSWMKYLPVELGLEASGNLSLNHPYVAVPYVTPGAESVALVTPRIFQAGQHSLEINTTAGLDLFWLHPYVGAGTAVVAGWGAPDVRLFAGFRLTTEFSTLFPPKKTEPVKDRDHDGVPDAQDTCPDVPGPRELAGCPPVIPPPILPPVEAPLCERVDDAQAAEQVDACPVLDNDGDGQPNFVDRCPLLNAATRDGCPAEPDAMPPVEADTDGDGITGDKDLCPQDPEDRDGFEDQDGCPELDNDRDGVPDTKDACPLESETINGVEDSDGCPDVGKSLVKLDLLGGQIMILDKVYFETGKASIKSRSHDLLKQVASVMRANPDIKVTIEGHTDNQGKPEANLKLSQARAQSVMNFLVEDGIDVTRLNAKGYGQTRPVQSNTTGKGREANRRVEFVVQVEEAPEGKEEKKQ